MIDKAIDVIKAVLLVNTIPASELSLDKIDVVIAEPDPNIISVTSNSTFFLFQNLYSFL